MRSRVIRPEFWSDAALARLSHGARLTFIGMWMIADREGRLIDSPLSVCGQLYPYEGPEMLHQVDRWIADLAQAGLIARYEADGVRAIQIRSFARYQPIHWSEKPSRIPPPPQDAATAGPRQCAPRHAHEDAHGFRLQEIASRIFERHPAHRRGSLHMCEQALAEALSGAVDPCAVAESIDRAHAQWCASEQWCRNGGRYVPRLDRWLAQSQWQQVPVDSEEF